MQAIQTKFLPATDTKGTRIRAKAYRDSLQVSYAYERSARDNHVAAARSLLLHQGIRTGYELTTGELPDGSYCHVVKFI